MERSLIGIDEAGRGALAGPVAVGVVLLPSDINWRTIFKLVTKNGKVRLRDSKQLSALQRDILYEQITSHGQIKHACAFIDAAAIDEIGIVCATHKAAAQAVARLGANSKRVEVLLDAGLKVPPKWAQKSFVRGDETIPAIAFASIVAKVSRDRLMKRLSSIYSEYNFDKHKGYGTLAHRHAIQRSGLSEVHRTTFCTRLLVRENAV